MRQSKLQEPFLQELVAAFQATKGRILRRLNAGESAEHIVEDELKGLFHGLLVTFDGGTALADNGLIHIVDEEGVKFQRCLHEICFGYWPHQEPS